jgi:hypothetical protein
LVFDGVFIGADFSSNMTFSEFTGSSYRWFYISTTSGIGFFEIAGRDYKKQPCDENDKNGFKFPHFNNQLIHCRNR